MLDRQSRIYVAGHKGLVGSAVVRCLRNRGFENIVTANRSEVDLCDQRDVHQFFRDAAIEYAFIAAARVGGILYNQNYQADFLYDNLMIAANVLHAAAQYDVKKLLYLGSSCIYPKHASQPIKEEYLLSGVLEPTNEGYALAKIAGLKLCEKYFTQYGKRFISAMPTNLYGPGDNFHPDHSHVIPGMMRRFYDAKQKGLKEVVIWGTGAPRREFLFVDDLAEALYLLMERYEEPKTVNIGCGSDISIYELACLMKETVGFEGEIGLDPSKPDGTLRKLLDVSRMEAIGWSPKTSLRDGLKAAFEWAIENGKLTEDVTGLR